MTKSKMLRVYVALVFLFGLFAQFSYADDIVRFWVGSQNDPNGYYLSSDKTIVEKFPNSILARVISGNASLSQVLKDEKVYNEKTRQFENQKVPCYLLDINIDQEVFSSILHWMATKDTSKLRKQPRDIVLKYATLLVMPELSRARGEEGVCPPGYILVPGNVLYHTPEAGKDFCLMKYAASVDETGKAVSVMGGPLLNMSQAEATKACEANGADFHLVTNDEWMVTVRDIEANKDNWSGGAVGVGSLSRGNSDSSSALRPWIDDDPHFGLPKEHHDWAHKRTHILSNNETIWDMAGNGWNRVSGKLSTIYLFDSCKEFSDKEYFRAGSEWKKQFGPLGPFDSKQNTGTIFMGNSGAVLRGGSFRCGSSAGVFATDLTRSNSYGWVDTVFRCSVPPKSKESPTIDSTSPEPREVTIGY